MTKYLTENLDASNSARSVTAAHSFVSRFAAFGLVAASAGFGMTFAWETTIGHGFMLAALAVLFALSLELAKPLAVAGAIEACRSLALGRAVLLAVLAFVGIAYSLSAELQLMSRGRADAIAARADQSTRVSAAVSHRDQVKASVTNAGATSRSASEIRPVIDGKLASRTDLKSCEPGTVPRADAARLVCTEVASLRAELARAERIESLALDLVAAESVLAELGSLRVIDPGSKALASYLAALGFNVSPERLGDWLTLVAVLALEVGSALAGVLASSGTTSLASNRQRVAGMASVSVSDQRLEHPEQLVPPPHAASPGNPGVHVPERRANASTRERVLGLIADAGGTVRVEQRAMSRELGVSASTINGVLARLVENGEVKKRTSSTGTVLTLA